MVHIHDVAQQCVSRNGGACYPYETIKETWYLAPGEALEVRRGAVCGFAVVLWRVSVLRWLHIA